MGSSTSVKIAAIIAVIFVTYFGIRTALNSAEAPSEANTGSEEELFSVLVTTIEPQSWQEKLIVRGRTQALRKVRVRAETPGTISRTPVKIGTSVKQGDTLCELRLDARRAQLDQARAALAKAKIDYDAASTLRQEGFGAETSVATTKAALDLARANVRQAELVINQTKITAPFDGIFDQRFVEAGDYLKIGDPCGEIIQLSPFLIVGSVSEREVGKVSVGDRGLARLATGETIEGDVRFVGTGADALTRTFKIELEVANPDGKLRDGVTAEFTIFANRRNAYLVPRSAMILNDAGQIGVRTVQDSEMVAFTPVNLLGEAVEGVWVSGLEGRLTLIVRGQEFVTAGQRVKTETASNTRTGDAS